MLDKKNSLSSLLCFLAFSSSNLLWNQKLVTNIRSMNKETSEYQRSRKMKF